MAYEYRGNTIVNQGERLAQRSRTNHPNRGTGRRSVAQVLALVFGVTFLLVGTAGFIPGITQNFDQLSLLGRDSGAELLGIFQVSIVHNIVHMLFGVGILAAASEKSALAYLIGGGVVYAVVAAYGSLIEKQSDANFLPVNHADNLLHTGLAVGFLAAGLVALAASRRSRSLA